MRDGQARKEIAILRADIRFLKDDVSTLVRTLRLAEEALEELGLECVPAQKPKWRRRAATKGGE